VNRVLRQAQGQFVVQARFEERPIVLDFNYLLQASQKYRLQAPFLLLHWQGKLADRAEWGVYDPQEDKYFSIAWDSLFCTDSVRLRCLQMPWQETIRPTAVIALEGVQYAFDELTHSLTIRSHARTA